jgi:hypothetical protein
VDDVAGHEDVLAVAADAREAELVVVLAELRVARLAAPAAVTRDHPLADHAVSRLEVADALSGLGDRPAPFVARDDGEANPARIGQPAVDDLEVCAADPGDVAADDHLVGSGRRLLDLDVRDLVRALDDDGLHAAHPITSPL